MASSLETLISQIVDAVRADVYAEIRSMFDGKTSVEKLALIEPKKTKRKYTRRAKTAKADAVEAAKPERKKPGRKPKAVAEAAAEPAKKDRKKPGRKPKAARTRQPEATDKSHVNGKSTTTEVVITAE